MLLFTTDEMTKNKSPDPTKNMVESDEGGIVQTRAVHTSQSIIESKALSESRRDTMKGNLSPSVQVVERT